MAGQSCEPLAGILHVMKYSAAFNDVKLFLKLIRIKNIKLLVVDMIHFVFTRFPHCVGQAASADINCRDLRVSIAASVHDLISRSAPRNQKLGVGVGR